MATHSSVLAWRIPGTVEPGRLPSLGSHKVGHNSSDLAAAAAAVIKNLPANTGDTSFIPGSGRSLGEGNLYSNIPVWEISWTEEPGRLPSMGLHRVRHD